MATSASQWGITWTWVEDLTVVQYANGEYCVVAPTGLTMTSITPASTLVLGRTINGTMINPVGNSNTIPQGFDSAFVYGTYLESQNKARPGNLDLSVGNPLAVAAGSSLVSTISRATAGVRPQLQTAAILTVVASAPAANSFRPPYCGTDKTAYWTTADLDYSVLSSLASVGSPPTLATVEDYFEHSWIEINTDGNAGRYMHPTDNQPDYGEDMAIELGTGLMLLALDYTNPQKETLLIRMVQYGIDIYGCANTGGVWKDLGGHNQGRLMLLIQAGLALADADILAYADPALLKFQENRQTFIVDEAELALVPYYGDDRERMPYALKSATVTFDLATNRVMWLDHGFFDTTPVVFSTAGVMPVPLVAAQTYLVRGETVTISAIASPSVVGWSGHGLSAGDAFRFTVAATSGGSLPVIAPPVVQNTTYYVLASGLTADAFQFSATPGGAAINTTAVSSGAAVTGLANKYFKLNAIYGGSYVDITTTGTGTQTGVYDLLGVAEWGEQHTKQNNRDGSNWNVNYRGNIYGSLLAHALAARLTTGAIPAWNWPPFFSYMDRVRTLAATTEFPAFHNAMWVAYRDVFAPPSAPTSLTATTVSASRIDLAWVDNAIDEDGFSIEQSLDGEAFTVYDTAAANAVSFSVTGLSSAVTYYYRVRAFKNLGGYSTYTNIDSDTTTIPPLSAGQPGTAGLLMSS